MKKLPILLLVFFTSALFSQEKQEYNKLFLDPNSSHAKAQILLIKDLRDTIEKKLESLGRKHVQLAFLSPELKDRHVIITEDSPSTYDKGFESDILKYISFDFSGEKIIKLTIGSNIKRIQYDLGFENKLIVYLPSNFDTSFVKMTKFDRNSELLFKDMSLDSQIESLRLILSYINLAFYRVEMMIVTKREQRELDSLRLLDI